MKTFSQSLLCLLLLVGPGLFPTIGLASETRLDATGGLLTIVDDETTDLDLFLDGNPAGLVLLNSRDRFDLSGFWSYSDKEGPWGVNRQQVFTTIPRYTDTPIRYEGLMLFPDPHWAVQVLGDTFMNQGVSVTNYSNDTETLSQYRGVIRVAYALPFAALGLEIQDSENDKNYNPGLYNPYVGLSSGTGAQNQLLVKTGLVTTFPARTSPQDPRWQVGGFFLTQVGSSLQNQAFNLFYAGGPSFPVNQIVTTAGYSQWGAELLYELPSVTKIRFSASMINSDSYFEQTVPFTSPYFATLSKFHASQFQSMNVQGNFRCTLPFDGEENLRLGGGLGTYFNNKDLISTVGNVYNNQNRQQINSQFGIGLETPKDYTMGFQWKSVNYIYGTSVVNNSPAGFTQTDDSYDYYQLAFGGEKWVSSTWAFRLGLVLEVDDYSATSTSALTTSINAGAGLEEAFGRADFRFLLGQMADLNNSSNAVGVLGAQLSTTLFL